MADDSKKPYGDVTYADPGYQDDKKKRYPLDSEEHCRAAWSYINQQANAAKYTPEQVASIKAKIKAAAKKFGISIEEDKKTESRSDDEFLAVTGEIETRSSHVAVDGVNFPERIITLIAVPYEQPAQVVFQRDMWNEVFSRTAFNGLEQWLTSPRSRSIPATASLVIPNPDHDNGKLIGRVIEARSGTIGNEEGLIAKVKVSSTHDGDDTLQFANDGAVSPSVGFQIKNPASDQHLDRYTKTRRINRAFLHHLSFVAEPAYSGARILSVRSAEDLSTANPVGTPLMDQFINDPVMRWANETVTNLNI